MKGSRKYRKMMCDLDGVGLLITINRVGRKQYDFIQNGEIVKSYKKRDSCNQLLKKNIFRTLKQSDMKAKNKQCPYCGTLVNAHKRHCKKYPKNIFSIEEFKELGFQLYDSGGIDNDGAFYEVYAYWRDSSLLEISFEFNKDGIITNSYAEFQHIKLEGVQVSISQIKQLIKIIYNDDL